MKRIIFDILAPILITTIWLLILKYASFEHAVIGLLSLICWFLIKIKNKKNE